MFKPADTSTETKLKCARSKAGPIGNIGPRRVRGPRRFSHGTEKYIMEKIDMEEYKVQTPDILSYHDDNTLCTYSPLLLHLNGDDKFFF